MAAQFGAAQSKSSSMKRAHGTADFQDMVTRARTRIGDRKRFRTDGPAKQRSSSLKPDTKVRSKLETNERKGVLH